MTRTEHLLTILAEECAEVAQRVSKALRFGPTEIQPGQRLTNAERINEEVADLMTALEMLNDNGTLPRLTPTMADYHRYAAAKKAKVERFLVFSAGRGLVDDVPGDPATPHPEARPLDVVLYCPECGVQHIDKPEPDKGWDNPPHKSHLCHNCGAIWRPADVPTNGVARATTRGEKDTV